jgi:hypothetical protein
MSDAELPRTRQKSVQGSTAARVSDIPTSNPHWHAYTSESATAGTPTHLSPGTADRHIRVRVIHSPGVAGAAGTARDRGPKLRGWGTSAPGHGQGSCRPSAARRARPLAGASCRPRRSLRICKWSAERSRTALKRGRELNSEVTSSEKVIHSKEIIDSTEVIDS